MGEFIESTIEKIIIQYKERKKSGWLKIIISLSLIIIFIPLLFWGISQSCYNGIVWCQGHRDRKVTKTQSKIKKAKSKKELEEAQKELQEYKEVNKNGQHKN